MKTYRISPDRAPYGTYDPVYDIIKDAQKLTGIIAVHRDVYYREWVIDFDYDETVVPESEFWKQIRVLEDKYNSHWGEVIR